MNQVDAFDESDAQISGRLERQRAVGSRVDLRHVHETRPEPVVVTADERVLAEQQVDVIGDHHQAADRDRGIHQPSRGRDHHSLDAHSDQGPDRERDLVGRAPFVQVHATQHRDQRHTAALAHDHPACMTNGRGHHEVWDLAVVDRGGAAELICISAEPGAEDQTDARSNGRAAEDELSRLARFVVLCFRFPASGSDACRAFDRPRGSERADHRCPARQRFEELPLPPRLEVVNAVPLGQSLRQVAGLQFSGRIDSFSSDFSSATFSANAISRWTTPSFVVEARLRQTITTSELRTVSSIASSQRTPPRRSTSSSQGPKPSSRSRP